MIIEETRISILEQVFSKIKPEYLIHLAWNIKDLDSNSHFDLLSSSIRILTSFYKNGGKKLSSWGLKKANDFKRFRTFK